MKSTFITLCALLTLTTALPQAPTTINTACPKKPAYFLLAGDSTTATQHATNTSDGGGWGDSFLNYTLKCKSSGQNFGHNGATTASFRAGGDWASVLAQVAAKKQKNNVFVTVQFGHNDQKVTSGVGLAQYSANLRAFAMDVFAAGGTPILVTPLTRRSYTNTTGYPLITEDLTTQRILTLQAAHATNSRFIDLNSASTVYCDEIGPDGCWRYNLADYSYDVTAAGTDHTHLNVWGSTVFGRMVSDLMAKYADIAAVTAGNETLSVLIANGIAA